MDNEVEHQMAWQHDERSAAIGEMAVATPSTGAGSSKSSGATPDQQIPFFYGIPVWGETYVEALCSMAIPSLLAPGSIPSMPNNNVSSFVIATTPVDEKVIRASAIFNLLERYIRVEFCYLPDKEGVTKYWIQTAGHRMTVERALGKGCAIFLAPDAIYTNGLTRCLFDHVTSGKQAVFGFGPRVVEQSMVPDLIEQGYLKPGQPLAISPRQGVKLLMRHLHHDARVQRWTSPHFPTKPYMCVWDMPDGMLVRPFSLHPYAVDYRDLIGWRHPPYEVAGSVDGFLVKECAIAWDKIHRVSDSDEFFVLSLTSMHTNEYGFEANNDLLGTLARWMSSTIPAIDQWHFTNAIKLHSEDLDDRWRQLERETLRIAYDVLEEARLLPKARGAVNEVPERELLTELLARVRDIEAAVVPHKRSAIREFSDRALVTELLARIGRTIRRGYRRLTNFR